MTRLLLAAALLAAFFLSPLPVAADARFTLEWVDWFNNHSLFGPIGNIPSAEAEANHYAVSENLDMSA